VLELDGKRQLSVATGNEITPGNRLVKVAIDHVVIERGGVRQQIFLEGKATAIKSAAAASVLSASAVVEPVALQRMLNNKGGL
jgi:general secretion pathway protein C